MKGKGEAEERLQIVKRGGGEERDSRGHPKGGWREVVKVLGTHGAVDILVLPSYYCPREHEDLRDPNSSPSSLCRPGEVS